MSRTGSEGWTTARRWLGTMNLTLRIALLPAHVLFVDVSPVAAEVVEGFEVLSSDNVVNPVCTSPRSLFADRIS